VLDEIAYAKRYVMDEQARCAATLGWSLPMLDFAISPRLAVRSPMKRCGKTTLLGVWMPGHEAADRKRVCGGAISVVEGYRPRCWSTKPTRFWQAMICAGS
jgi:hypothetical protein